MYADIVRIKKHNIEHLDIGSKLNERNFRIVQNCKSRIILTSFNMDFLKIYL